MKKTKQHDTKFLKSYWRNRGSVSGFHWFQFDTKTGLHHLLRRIADYSSPYYGQTVSLFCTDEDVENGNLEDMISLGVTR